MYFSNNLVSQKTAKATRGTPAWDLILTGEGDMSTGERPGGKAGPEAICNLKLRITEF